MTTTTPTLKTLPVVDIYGPVCQGEGALIGRPTVFVRLGGCDDACVWCDSKHAVDAKTYKHEWRKLTAPAIVAEARACVPAKTIAPHVTISGGNPALHDLGDLIEGFAYGGWRVAIETQGTVVRPYFDSIDDLTISPKGPSSGNGTSFGPTSVLYRIVTGRTPRHVDSTMTLKIVVFTDGDYAYARAVHQSYLGVPMVLQVGTYVGTSTRDELCHRLIRLQDRVCTDPIMFDCAVLPQLHALLRGHGRTL